MPESDSKPRVLITPLCGVERSGWVNPSLFGTLLSASHDQRFGMGIDMVVGAHGVDRARNLAVDRARERQVDWLVMLDNDVTCPNLLNILGEADSAGLDVVSVAYGINIGDGNAANHSFSVTLVDPREQCGNFLRINNCGAGVLMIRRTVWEKLATAPLFQWTQECGEDVYFARLVQAAGFKLWTHSSLAGHLHTTDITALVHQ